MMPLVIPLNLRIVLDTAAFINAIRSNTGAASEIVRLAMLGEFVLLLDYKLVCEYRDVALRPRHLQASQKTSEEVAAIIDDLESIATPVLVEFRHRPLSPDLDDDMVLDVAINGNADAVVTSNAKHFVSAAKPFGIKVLTPTEFLVWIRKEGFYDSGQ